ncbi:MAG: metal-dependent hydrolase [Thermoplasmata archaeon]
MKGITHFIFGAMLATFFVEAVRAAILEKNAIILLGGCYGILPDTLDFKLARYIEPEQYVIDPWTTKFDPQLIATTMAKAINEAHETKKRTKFKIHTVKLGADWWRRLSVSFDLEKKIITARVEGIINTGQVPIPGTEPPAEKSWAIAKYKPDLIHDYDKETYVQIFSGPDFEFVPVGDKVRVDFIPWHRRWSHSFTYGAALGFLGFILGYIFTPTYLLDAEFGRVYFGLIGWGIATFGFWGHVIEDQTGLMGSNLFPPFTKDRTKGLSMKYPGFGNARSADAIPNFIWNWSAVAIAIYNFNMFSYVRAFTPPLIAYVNDTYGPMPFILEYIVGFINYALVVIVAPLSVIYVLSYLHYRKNKADERFPERKITEEELRAKEMLAEMGDGVEID